MKRPPTQGSRETADPERKRCGHHSDTRSKVSKTCSLGASIRICFLISRRPGSTPPVPAACPMPSLLIGATNSRLHRATEQRPTWSGSATGVTILETQEGASPPPVSEERRPSHNG